MQNMRVRVPHVSCHVCQLPLTATLPSLQRSDKISFVISLRRVTPIVGPRFECLHCPTDFTGRFNVCFRCEPQLHVAGGHPENHAFDRKMPANVGGPGPGPVPVAAVYVWEYCEELGFGAALGDPFWERQGADGAWAAYAPDLCEQLEAAFADPNGPRITGAAVEIGNGQWVSLKKMQQRHWDNEDRFEVRRVDPAGDAPAGEDDWIAYNHVQCVVLTEAYLQQIDPPVVALEDGTTVDFSQMSQTIPGDARRFRVRGRLNDQSPPVAALRPAGGVGMFAGMFGAFEAAGGLDLDDY